MILSSLTLVLMVGYARFWTTIAEKEVKKIEEQDVVLPCQHRFGHLVTKNLDIEWLLQDSEPNQKVLGLIPFFGEGDLRGMVYQCSSISHPAGPLHPADYIHPFEDLSSTWQVITYSLGSVYENLSAKQRGRISFAADYMMGDASIKISSLQATDSGLYTCKVKNAGEYDWKPAINLVVLVRPSKPKCWTQGQLLQGNDVKLQCRSEKGTEPILYRWERLLDAEGQKAKFQTRSHIDSRTPEMLLLRNLSHTNSGVYQCSATNEAGQESCSVNITVTYAKDPGIIAGAVIGVMLGLLLIFLIVWFTLYRKAKHKYEEEEQPNEIREDAEAPKAKLSSTQSSVGTGSTQSGSCSVKSIRNGTPYSQQPRTPSAKEEKMLISYTSTEEVKINKNGPTQAHMKRMGAVPVMIPAQTKAFQTV